MLNKKLIKIQGDIIDLEAIYMISEIKDDCFDIFFYNTEIPKTVEFNIDYINSEFKNILNKRGLLNELRSEHIDWKTGKFLSDITYETYEKERVELRELESKK